MSTEANKDLVCRLVAGINQRNLDVTDEVFAEDFVDHDPAPGLPSTREGFKQALGMFIAAFPDLTLHEEDLIAEGDKVVYRGSFTGTQQSDFMGIPASGRQVTCSEIHIVRCANGRVVEHWEAFDTLGLLQNSARFRRLPNARLGRWLTDTFRPPARCLAVPDRPDGRRGVFSPAAFLRRPVVPPGVLVIPTAVAYSGSIARDTAGTGRRALVRRQRGGKHAGLARSRTRRTT